MAAVSLYLDTSAILRAVLRLQGQLPESRLADVEREIDSVRARCELWEITAAVCGTASLVAPARPLRALDAIHLAIFVLARRRIAEIELLTVDDRLRNAAAAV